MAEVDAHELRAEVEIALAGAVGEPAAFGIGDMERLPGFLEPPGAVVGLARDGGDLLGGELRGRVVHCGESSGGMEKIVSLARRRLLPAGWAARSRRQWAGNAGVS